MYRAATMMDDRKLKKALKNRYPFRLGTTSFIYPDLYSENVKKLAPYVDEIELLFFESIHPEAIPDAYEIKALAELKKMSEITYNIHLPTDVVIAAANPSERNRAVDVISRVIDLTEELDPVTYTLHIPYEEYPGGTNVWQAYVLKGLATLFENGMDQSLISLETLDYSPDLFHEALDRFDISICLDIGHMFVHGYDPLAFYGKFKERISIIHLHGVDGGSDHLSLDQLQDSNCVIVRDILKDFTGSLSIEVFSFNDLRTSLDVFEKWM